MIKIENSPIQKINYLDFDIFIKRDDLLSTDFSGNKARKFLYFLDNGLCGITKIVSFGSNQSNAMYSLSVLCKDKNIDFEYYTDHIPKFLQLNPVGNYKYAVDNGMKIYLFKTCKYSLLLNNRNLLSKTEKIGSTLFIPEGGRCETSRYGINKLSQEIIEFKKNKKFKNLKIFLPSGTGTTALYLQQCINDFKDNTQVFTVACVGGERYLKKQFLMLEKDPSKHPKILSIKKYHFGKLNCELYKFWIKLGKQTKIQFDLLYDPIGFKSMIEYLENNNYNNDENIIYIHQGGIQGNESMKLRYKRKCGENI